MVVPMAREIMPQMPSADEINKESDELLAGTGNETTPPLPRFDELQGLDDTDRACMGEIREVLRKYGKIERFGLQFLHRHFDVGPEEILVERSDPDARSMVLQVLRRNEIKNEEHVDTAWHLGRSPPVSLVKCRSAWHVDY